MLSYNILLLLPSLIVDSENHWKKNKRTFYYTFLRLYIISFTHTSSMAPIKPVSSIIALNTPADCNLIAAAEPILVILHIRLGWNNQVNQCGYRTRNEINLINSNVDFLIAKI